MKNLKNINNIVKLQELAYEISLGEYELEENIEEFRKLLKEEKENGLDLNGQVTILRDQVEGEEIVGMSNLSYHWEELIKRNWSGSKYAGEIRDNYIYSLSVHDMITGEYPAEKVEEVIDEIYPYCTKMYSENSIIYLKDIINDKGYLKVTIINDNYLITDDEKDKFEEWIEKFEDIEDVEDLNEEYYIKAKDFIKDEDVYFVAKANQYNDFENFNKDLGFLNMRIVK